MSNSGDGFEGIFHEIVDNSDDVILLVDREFKIRYASAATQRKFKKDSLVLLGKNVFDFISADKRVQWKSCLRSNTPQFSEDIRLEILGQKLYFEVNVLTLRNGIGWVFRLYDITERKIREKKLIVKNKQLDHVLYKTIHDLKAPVSSMLGLVNLAERTENKEEREQYVSLIRRSLVKMDSFIDEMGDFFRNEKFSVQRSKISLTDIIQSEVEHLKNLHQVRNILVEINVNEEVEFYSDNVRIKTVVTNILSNAIKYSDSRKENPFIKITGFVDEEFCGLRFEDNGIGVEPEHSEKIFDMFFRATSQAQGSGLGLYIVKDTIERLSGTIVMRSNYGVGTTFEVQIPNQILQPSEVE
ncbi:MAG TPA: PAS domain-containing sensor histidine kinase [Cyclobacteriaceae bacterium]|jgi:PAS domain S-box-containing protein|nr:PAS domain-containing sensor histidine kinase [Cyclobacteriaceae bacterium]